MVTPAPSGPGRAREPPTLQAPPPTPSPGPRSQWANNKHTQRVAPSSCYLAGVKEAEIEDTQRKSYKIKMGRVSGETVKTQGRVRAGRCLHLWSLVPAPRHVGHGAASCEARVGLEVDGAGDVLDVLHVCPGRGTGQGARGEPRVGELLLTQPALPSPIPTTRFPGQLGVRGCGSPA